LNREIGPVIVTIVIVAIAITLAIGIALWVTFGVENISIKVEEVNYSDRYLILELKNIGPTTVIKEIVIRGEKIQGVQIDKELETGKTIKIKLNNLKIGGKIEILVRTAIEEYSTFVQLPYEYTLP
jgi:hypothetical protein